MPKMDGVELEAVKNKTRNSIVMISGHGDMKRLLIRCDLVHLIISKPPDLNRLLNTVRNALDKTTRG
jgi:FixJ family two-component response regulator